MVADRREDEGQRHRQHHQPPRRVGARRTVLTDRDLTPRRRGQHQHRPVPQVPGVGDPADVPGKGTGQRAGDEPVGEPGAGGDEQRRAQDRHEGGCAGEGCRLVHRHGRPEHHDQADQCRALGGPAGQQREHRPNQGQCRPDPELPGSGVQPEVRERARRTGLRPGEPQRPGDHDAEGQGDPADGHRPRTQRQTRSAHEEEEQERPHHVELLLDGQGPVVQYRALVGVGHVLGGLRGEPPVRAPQGGTDDVTGDALAVDRRDQCDGRGGGGGEDEGGQRQEPPDPPGVEVTDRDGARPGDLVDEQAGDEEAGQHEEDVDPDEAAADHSDARVERHHQHDGHRPQTLDVGTEPTTSPTPRPCGRDVRAGQGFQGHTAAIMDAGPTMW